MMNNYLFFVIVHSVMSDIIPVSLAKYPNKNLFVFNDVTDAYSGQINAVARIGDPSDNVVMGYVEYSLYNGKVYINMLETKPEFRRTGVATALMNYLKESNPGKQIIQGMATEEGYAFSKSGKFRKNKSKRKKSR